MSRPTLLVVAAVLAAGCASSPATHSETADAAPTAEPATPAAAEVGRLADRYVEEYFAAHPDAATAEGWEGADHARLPDRSPQGLARWQAIEDELLRELAAVDRAALDGTAAALTHDFLAELLEASVGARVCHTESWEVSPTWTGWPARYSYLATVQPVATAAERAAAVERAQALARYLDQEVANLRAGLAAGRSAPRVNVERVIEQVDSLLAGPPEESPFLPAADRVADPATTTALAAAARDELYPAMRRYRDFLAGEYLPAARTEVAVAANPDGEACYRAAVRLHTSLDISAEEIHRAGLEQMERLTAEMAAIGERSFGVAEPRALLDLVSTDPRYTFESRQEILAVARDAVARAEAAVPRWFGIVPEAEVQVVPYPEFRERSAPGGEYSSATGDRPGTYYINTYRPETQSRAGIEATAFHEAYPGHHLQISIAKEREQSHAVQRYFGVSGYVEGWALYTERLAEEMGLYSGDVDRLGLLSNEALRAGRLVVDSGMHALGWSRERAIDYLAAHTAESRDRIEAEIDRYIAVPGQATSYMLGNLEIRRLRALAEQRLGDDFDVREFHDRVLEDGALTLAMLRAKIERWLAAAG